MKFGMNVLLWTGELNEGLLPILERLKQIGYDGIEVPIFNLDLDYRQWGARLNDLGLERTAVTIRTAEDNPISPNATVRQRSIELTQKAIDCCVDIGATHLVGPFHSALGEFSGQGPTTDEWNWGVDSLRPVAEYAGKAGVTLALECLNRFETYLLNTHADAVRFVEAIDHPNCQIMYDTFHANIEEKDEAAAVRAAGDWIAHVHISENDRSTPGQGNVRWEETFDALREINYDGWLTVEAFGLALPELAAATKIWRRMYATEDQLAAQALTFMQQHVARRWAF
ncbi:MAG TPA: sugar phosphate isomerase/epimerase family protein [Pirellulaceae bacterium]|nr:sugar phosphate isomerase/epimerase family protein [Pirellulaceae bacterium]HMO93678.1 sugar phosphate isomerase/epimerase family protein [Pirellulaceae bacterium]HMP68420.1 sugar phosphate isomerase/epimerase family protein [Pirellulaceae bacterium]